MISPTQSSIKSNNTLKLHPYYILTLKNQTGTDLDSRGYEHNTQIPSFLVTHLSSMNPLNGASPVPGPTMMTGHVDRYGSLRVDLRT